MSDDLVERLRDASSRPTRDSLHLGQYWNLCDEAADEIERLRGELALKSRDALEARQDVRDLLALKNENERLRRDAERYRWLREDRLVAYVNIFRDGEFVSVYGIGLDAAIDAAMEKEKRDE